MLNGFSDAYITKNQGLSFIQGQLLSVLEWNIIINLFR